MDTTQQAEAVIVSDPLAVLQPELTSKLELFKERLGIAVLRLEEESLDVAEALEAITVTDAIEHDEMGERLKLAVEFTDRATGFFEPWRELFRGPYQAVLDRKKGVLDGVTASVAKAKRAILEWEHSEQMRRDLEARVLQEKLRVDEEVRKLALAVQAEAGGMNEQAVEQILSTPSVAPTVTAAPIARPTGISGRKNWKAEVMDLGALIEAAAKDKRYRVYLQADMSKLDKQAKVDEGALEIPGVRPVNQGSLAIRR